MDDMYKSSPMEAAFYVHEFYVAAESILQRERTAIETDPGVWNALLASLRIRPLEQ